MPYKFTHTRLYVHNFEACYLFYRDIIGLTPFTGDSKGPYADFATGDVKLALFNRQLMAQIVGRQHEPVAVTAEDRLGIVFEVDNVDAEYERLSGLGITFTTLPTDRPDWGLRTAHFRDPDDNLVEIIARLQS